MSPALYPREETLRELLLQGGGPVAWPYFTPTELLLVNTLLASGTGYASHEELARVTGWPPELMPAAVKSLGAHLHNLRRKGVRIESVRGKGRAFVFADVWSPPVGPKMRPGCYPRFNRTRRGRGQFAAVLRAFRERHVLDTYRLGEILGRSRTTASAWLNAKHEPPDDVARRMLRAMAEYEAARREETAGHAA